MAALNKVILIGRLTHDPELRYTPNGQPVANFSIAVDRKMSKNDETDFIPIVAWRRLAEICNEFLHKGKLVSIDGRLQVRSYEDKEGRRQRAFEVVAEDMQMLDRGPTSSGGGGGGGDAGGGQYSQNRPARPAMAAAPSPRGASHDDGGGFPPSDDSLGIEDIPF